MDASDAFPETASAAFPSWYRPPGVKTKYDFPKAKTGRPDRYEFDVG